MLINPASSRLRATTIAIDEVGNLADFLRVGDQAFFHGNEGFVALGEVARCETDSIDEANRWWIEMIDSIENDTEMPGRFGTGPIGIGSFLFDPDHSSQRSVLIIPEIIIGRRQGQSWITQIGYDQVTPILPERSAMPSRCEQVEFSNGSVSETEWKAIVAECIERIKAGEARKVVLARDLIARSSTPIDLRSILRWLRDSYGSCWNYLVDGLVGSTPEMLIRRESGLTTSRILAGTIPRIDGVDDIQQASRLMGSVKDLQEHRLAVESVVDRIRDHLQAMHVADAPFVLTLPNVMHLATDLCGISSPEVTTLSLAGAVHPSAAVCGLPTDKAREIIASLEKMDRGRYSGIVGWLDAQGDGEWALALRCGYIDADDPCTMRIFAGGGIVANSDPHAELVETEAKMGPMRSALRSA